MYGSCQLNPLVTATRESDPAEPTIKCDLIRLALVCSNYTVDKFNLAMIEHVFKI